MEDKLSNVLASIGLALGGVLGLAGAFAPSAVLRSLAWGVDGAGIVMASALLMLGFHRKGQDLVAAGFLVLAIGEGVILSGGAIDLDASIPSFGAGTALWAVALVLIGIAPAFPLIVRLLGFASSIMFAATALQIFAGSHIVPTAAPLPGFAYPFFVATMFGWIWTLLFARAKS